MNKQNYTPVFYLQLDVDLSIRNIPYINGVTCSISVYPHNDRGYQKYPINDSPLRYQLKFPPMNPSKLRALGTTFIKKINLLYPIYIYFIVRSNLSRLCETDDKFIHFKKLQISPMSDSYRSLCARKRDASLIKLRWNYDDCNILNKC